MLDSKTHPSGPIQSYLLSRAAQQGRGREAGGGLLGAKGKSPQLPFCCRAPGEGASTYFSGGPDSCWQVFLGRCQCVASPLPHPNPCFLPRSHLWVTSALLHEEKYCHSCEVLGWDGWAQSSVLKTPLELAEGLAEVWKGKKLGVVGRPQRCRRCQRCPPSNYNLTF